MIWHLLRYWLTFLLPTFYKKIQIKNLEHLQNSGAAILAMNHPNAFTDPMLIACVTYPIRIRYLARGDAFKPGIITWLLQSMGLVPIFRIQDGGKQGLKKNEESYQQVYKLLKRKKKVIVFVEGICVQERRLRPLKKGVARMVFGAYENIKDENLVVIPIGINYDNPSKFRSNVFYNVGEPILVKDFIQDFRTNEAKTNLKFIQFLETKMKSLVTHIDDKKNDDCVLMVEKLCKNDWLEKSNLDKNNLEHDFQITTQITELVNQAAKLNQEKLDTFTLDANTYFSKLKALNIDDENLRPKNLRKNNWANVIFKMATLILFSPIYLLGLFGNFLPMLIAHQLCKKLIKSKEFYSSFALGFAMILFSINYLIIYFVANYYLSNAIFSLFVCTGLMICGGLSLMYHPLLFNTVEQVKILKNKDLISGLSIQRTNLITLINKMKAQQV